MTISGFSFARNAGTLYYPIPASIRSILPVCDEFIIAVGKGDQGDRTRELITRINDPKIKIIDTIWPEHGSSGGHVFAQQTDLALKACKGDWCLYLQSDEAIHEKYLPIIKNACQHYQPDNRVEGFLFKFRHFWGDYEHFLISRCWYPREIRLVRNNIGIASYKDAQSFRRNAEKLNVVALDAEVFHYGWVRPPHLMQEKRKKFIASYQGEVAAEAEFKTQNRIFDYGSLKKLPRFTDTHPAVMAEWISRFNWHDQLDYKGVSKARHKHDLPRYRLHTWIEQKLLGGRALFGFKNYKIIRA